MADYQIEHMYDPWDGIGELPEDYQCSRCGGPKYKDLKGLMFCPDCKEKEDEVSINNEES